MATSPGASQYSAFISYSHAADGKLAPRLESALEGFAKPWYRRRALHIFRDETSLSATPGLWPTIEGALANSEFYILLASPDAAQSPWVNRELEWWLANKPHENVLIAATGGVLSWDDSTGDFDWNSTNALPPAARGVFHDEPLWVDVRWARDETQLSTKDPRFQDAIAELASPLHGRPKEDLVGEDVRQHRRTLRLVRGAVATLVVFVLLLTASTGVAVTQRGIADTQRGLAEERSVEADTQRAAAVSAQATAEARRQDAEDAQKRAEDQAHIALSRQLAAQAATYVDSQPDLGLLLAAEGTDRADTFEARSALIRGLLRSSGVKRILPADENISQLAASDDGSILAGAGDRGSVIVWDLLSGRQLWSNGQNEVAANRIAISSDGRYVASAHGKGSALRLNDARTGALVAEQDIWVDAVAFAPDGQTLAVVDFSGENAGLYDVPTLQKKIQLPVEGKAVAFSPGGTRLAISSIDVDDNGSLSSTITVWDLTAETGFRLEGPDAGGEVFDVAFAENDTQVIAREATGFRVWDLTADPPVSTFVSATSDNPPLPTTPRAEAVGFGTNPQAFKALADLSAEHSGRLSFQFAMQQDAAAILPDRRTVALAHGNRVLLMDLKPSSALRTAIKSDETSVTSLAFNPDGSSLAYAIEDGAIEVCDAASNECDAALEGLSDGASVMAFNHTGTLLAAAAPSRRAEPRRPPPPVDTLAVWNMETRSLLARWSVKGAAVDSLAFGADDATLLLATQSAGPTRVTHALIAASWEEGPQVREQMLDVPALSALDPAGIAALSPSGRHLAISGYTSDASPFAQQVQVVDLDNSSAANRTFEYDAPLIELVFSPDDQLLAGIGSTGASFQAGWEGIVIWDVSQGASLGPTIDRGLSFSRAVFSPDRKTLAAIGLSGLGLWDMTTYRPLSGYFGEGVIADMRPSTHIAFGSRDLLAVSYPSGAIDTWAVGLQAWHDRACTLANRNLTEAEWRLFLPAGEPSRPTCPTLAHRDQVPAT